MINCRIRSLAAAVLALASSPLALAGTPLLPSERSIGTLEPVARFEGAMPTSVAVSETGRIFVNFRAGAMT